MKISYRGENRPQVQKLKPEHGVFRRFSQRPADIKKRPNGDRQAKIKKAPIDFIPAIFGKDKKTQQEANQGIKDRTEDKKIIHLLENKKVLEPVLIITEFEDLQKH